MELENPMTIYETRDKRALLPLLLLADESERMIARYLGRGTMFVLDLRWDWGWDGNGYRYSFVITA